MQLLNRCILFFLLLSFGVSASASNKVNTQSTPALPAKVLAGYWQSWQSSDPVNPSIESLLNISNQYNVIEVAFAGISPEGSVNLDTATLLQGQYKDNAIKAIAQMNSENRPVLISVGGQNADFSVNSEQASENFTNSLENIIKTYGFAGVDFDIENGLTVQAGSTIPSAQNNVYYLINIIKALKQFNPNLIISLTPQTANIAYVPAISNAWNSYLPIINSIPEDIDLVQLQEYNSGSMPALDGKNYPEGNAAFIENITPVVISKWQLGSITYQGLPASKVIVGLPATKNNAAPAGGFVPFEQVKSAMQSLRQQFPGVRGLMTWDINYDAANDYQFANSLHDCAVNNQC